MFQGTMSHPPHHGYPPPSPRSASAASSTASGQHPHQQGRQQLHPQNYNSLERNRRRSGSSTGYVTMFRTLSFL